MNAKQAYLASIGHRFSVGGTEPGLAFVTQTGGIRNLECLHDRRSHDYELEKRYEALQKAHTALEKSHDHFAEL